VAVRLDRVLVLDAELRQRNRIHDDVVRVSR
jgi:hypothetical protein